MKANAMIWSVIVVVVLGFSIYKLYPVTTSTRYGVSIDLKELIRDENEKRSETLVIELGNVAYYRDHEPEFFSVLLSPGEDDDREFIEDLTSPAPIIKYKDGSEENCWFNIKTGELEFFSEAPPAERMREFIPQDQVSQNLYEEYIKQGKEPMAAAGSVLRDKIIEGLEKK